MKILIAPGHYLFSDKYGSEPLWACKLVYYLSKQVESLDVIVGINDCSFQFPANVKIIPIYRTRSRYQLVEAFRYITFLPTVTILSLYLHARHHYSLIHHMFPLSQWSLDLLPLLLTRASIIFGPMQLPQTQSDPSDIDLVLIGRKGNSFISFILGQLFGLLGRTASNITKKTFSRVSCIVFNSETAAQYYTRRFRFKATQVIPIGVDTPQEAKLPLSKSLISILCVAQLTKRKGQIYLLQAFTDLLIKYPQIHLNLVGDGDEQSELENFVNLHHLTSTVSFLGHIDHSKLASIYQKSHIFCLPSLSDPSPSAVLEAMSYGLPIVATNVGSIAEMVGMGGIIIPPGNSQALFEALQKLISSTPSRSKMGKLSQDRIKKYYNWENIAKTWIKLYQKYL